MIRLQIAKDVGATISELGTRMSAFEYAVRYEAFLYDANPDEYRKHYATYHMTPEQQIAQMKRVLH